MDKALTGAAGEHYIAFQLSARGYAVGLTAPGTGGADLLVANRATGKSLTVQVKTMTEAFTRSKKYGPYWKWRVGVRRAQAQKTFYYVFVDLKLDLSQSPDVFVVPSETLESIGVSTGLLEEYPDSGTPKTDAWCVIYDNAKFEAYRDPWGVIKAALT